jgi:hypothetical protein
MVYEVKGAPEQKNHDHLIQPGVRVRIVAGDRDRIGQTGEVASTYPGLRTVTVLLDGNTRFVTGYDFVEVVNAAKDSPPGDCYAILPPHHHDDPSDALEVVEDSIFTDRPSGQVDGADQLRLRRGR